MIHFVHSNLWLITLFLNLVLHTHEVHGFVPEENRHTGSRRGPRLRRALDEARVILNSRPSTFEKIPNPSVTSYDDVPVWNSRSLIDDEKLSSPSRFDESKFSPKRKSIGNKELGFDELRKPESLKSSRPPGRRKRNPGVRVISYLFKRFGTWLKKVIRKFKFGKSGRVRKSRTSVGITPETSFEGSAASGHLHDQKLVDEDVVHHTPSHSPRPSGTQPDHENILNDAPSSSHEPEKIEALPSSPRPTGIQPNDEEIFHDAPSSFDKPEELETSPSSPRPTRPQAENEDIFHDAHSSFDKPEELETLPTSPRPIRTQPADEDIFHDARSSFDEPEKLEIVNTPVVKHIFIKEPKDLNTPVLKEVVPKEIKTMNTPVAEHIFPKESKDLNPPVVKEVVPTKIKTLNPQVVKEVPKPIKLGNLERPTFYDSDEILKASAARRGVEDVGVFKLALGVTELAWRMAQRGENNWNKLAFVVFNGYIPNLPSSFNPVVKSLIKHTNIWVKKYEDAKLEHLLKEYKVPRLETALKSNGDTAANAGYDHFLSNLKRHLDGPYLNKIKSQKAQADLERQIKAQLLKWDTTERKKT